MRAACSSSSPTGWRSSPKTPASTLSRHSTGHSPNTSAARPLPTASAPAALCRTTSRRPGACTHLFLAAIYGLLRRFSLCRRPAYDYFDAEVLIPCDRRDDILWHTPLSWLNGNRDAWLDMKQRFDVPTRDERMRYTPHLFMQYAIFCIPASDFPVAKICRGGGNSYLCISGLPSTDRLPHDCNLLSDIL